MQLYKLLPESLWRDAESTGLFHGSEHDLRDGFIHFSTAEQLAETYRKYFAELSDIWLLTVDATQLGDALKFEPSRGGDLFPHLYAPLPVSAVLSAVPYAA